MLIPFFYQEIQTVLSIFFVLLFLSFFASLKTASDRSFNCALLPHSHELISSALLMIECVHKTTLRNVLAPFTIREFKLLSLIGFVLLFLEQILVTRLPVEASSMLHFPTFRS